MARISLRHKMAAAAALVVLCLDLMPLKTAAYQIPETLMYDISWAGIKAGETVIEIRESGGAVNIIVSTTSVKWISVFYHVDDRVESRVMPGPDKSSIGLPLVYRLNLKEGKHRKNKEVVFDSGRSKAFYRDFLTDERIEYDLPPSVFDPLSSFYHLRGMNLEVGKSAYIRIFDSKKIYDAEVQVLRKERIKTPWGPADTLVIKPMMKSEGIFYRKGEMLIWVTDDEKKIPVRMTSEVKIGSVTAELTGMKN